MTAWEQPPPRRLARLVSRRSLCGHVLSQRRAYHHVLVRCPNDAVSQHVGHRWTLRWCGDLLTLPGLPSGGRPDRLQASPQPDRLDLPHCRLLVDAHCPKRLLRRLRPCQARLHPVRGSERGARPVAVGAARGAAGHLPDPAVPQREATVEEVAPSSLALRGG